ncbi:MAG: Arc family DNA-binding protein [Gemmatimonadetes bacterium]|nr:Arc family DNA-binding protein [Gemmatimonadota bacterium]
MKERKAFLLRLSPELWSDLEAWAQEDLRSVNGQIEYLLRQAVLRRKGRVGEPPAPTAAAQAARRRGS